MRELTATWLNSHHLCLLLRPDYAFLLLKNATTAAAPAIRSVATYTNTLLWSPVWTVSDFCSFAFLADSFLFVFLSSFATVVDVLSSFLFSSIEVPGFSSGVLGFEGSTDGWSGSTGVSFFSRTAVTV